MAIAPGAKPPGGWGDRHGSGGEAFRQQVEQRGYHGRVSIGAFPRSSRSGCRICRRRDWLPARPVRGISEIVQRSVIHPPLNVAVERAARRQIAGTQRHTQPVLSTISRTLNSRGHPLPDHVHMMISIPPKYAVLQVVSFIEGKSAVHLARTYGEPPAEFRRQSFWARGYFVSTVGRGEKVIRNCVRNQEQEDQRPEQMNLWR